MKRSRSLPFPAVPVFLLVSILPGERPTVPSLSGEVACERPIRWMVAEVDERFGMTRAEAVAAVEEAVTLWEGATGRDLFVHDPEDGFPISFVYDSRHRVMQDRMERESSLAERAEEIRIAREELNRLQADLELERRSHEDRLTALRNRQAEYTRTVEYWESRGGPPPAEARELDRIAEELRIERRRINENAEALGALMQRVNARTEALNERIAEYNRVQAELGGGPGTAMLSGFYRESSRALGSWVLSRTREIEIYQFDDLDHLLRAVAHELGHALGLGYSDDPAAIMYRHARSARMGQRGTAGVQLHPSDLRLVEERCAPEGRAQRPPSARSSSGQVAEDWPR